jgi:hypothetical protein
MRIVRTIQTIEQVREYSVPAHITSEDDLFDYIAGIDEDISLMISVKYSTMRLRKIGA